MKNLIFILLIGFVLLFSSCSKKDNPVSPPEDPVIPPNPYGITYKSHTVEFDSKDAGYISSVTSNSITFSSENDKISKLKVGDVICVGISPKTPNGLLAKIAGLNKVGNSQGKTFSIIRAMLEDLIKDGKITFGKNLFSKTQNLYSTLYSDANSKVSISGNFSELGTLSGYFDFSGGTLKEMSINVSFSGSCDLNLDATYQGNFSKEKIILNQPFAAVLIWAAPPIVVVPTLTISASAEGDFSGTLHSGVKDAINSSVTINYNGSWTTGKSLGNIFTFKGVNVDAKANAKLKIKGKLSLLVQGVAGISAGLEPYSRLNAKISPQKTWVIYKGVDASLGISAGWLSPSINLKSWTFNLSESILSSGTFGTSQNHPPTVPSNPNPASGSQNVNSPVVGSWSCSDPDGDPLHYDLIVGVGSQIPVRIKNITQNSYNLGNFPSNSHVLWKVVAYDSHGDSSHGNLWSFWTSSANSFLPYNPSPYDGETNVGTLNSDGLLFADLRWDCVNPSTGYNIYSLYFGTDPNNLYFVTITTQKVQTVILLAYNTKCYWRVDKSVSGFTEVLTGEVWSFTTTSGGSGSVGSTFTDPRDGHVYKTTTIGTQTWFAENLDYASPNSTYYNNSSNYKEYGRLYNWNEANSYCPPGWHLPTREEWEELINFVGGYDVAGGKLKETGTNHWLSPNTGATDEYGFDAFGGGYFFSEATKGYYKIKEDCVFWTSSLVPNYPNAYPRISAFDIALTNNSQKIIRYTADGIDSLGTFSMESVRPIKNK